MNKSETMDRFKTAALTVLLSVLAMLLTALVFWYISFQVSELTLHLWTSIISVLIVPAMMAGWWFGKTEVRGFLAGADHMIDKSMGIFTRAVDYRDSSFRARAQIAQSIQDPRAMQSMFPPAMPAPNSPEVEL